VIVLTDIGGDPDDQQSMVRFLVYSNEFDVEGLIATSSIHRQDVIYPRQIAERVKAYGQVRPNLVKHADGYPGVEYLLDRVKAGRVELGMKGVGDGKDSPGSEWIISVADKPDPRPVWVTVWGGPNCLAQALWKVKHGRSQTELAAFVSKLRVYSISDQDDSAQWIRKAFPRLFYIVSPRPYGRSTWCGISGDKLRKFSGPDFTKVSNPWLLEHVRSGHGPLGELYPATKWQMEGDTPSFLYLLPNGLGDPEHPGCGSWGGRYEIARPDGETRAIHTDTKDTVQGVDGKTYTDNRATVWRWRDAYQNDFAARMDWCVSSRFGDANHNPIAAFDGDTSQDFIQLRVKVGDTVNLSASGSKDPDGDKLAFRWFQYPEAGTYHQEVRLRDGNSGQASFVAPDVTSAQAIHVILQVKDDGTPNLYSYRRVIVNVRP